MSRKFDSPVQTQMAVAVLNPSVTNECLSKSYSEGKPGGRRRVLVQTETGLVLDMELHRGDNVHTVKRRLQVVFNFPTEESSLTFGDLVLKNDLSAVRGDSPLLLTRNSMHRSSSTPCLSPSLKDLPQKALSGPIEILGYSSQCAQLEQLIKDVAKAIKSGIDPIPINSGLGGAYCFRNTKGDKAAIVKPTDEEPFAPNNPKGFIGKALGQPGLKRSVRIGETGFREVAAYLLDYNNFANVPLTTLVKITHPVFHVNDGVNCGSAKPSERRQEVISKIASLQQFIPHDFDAGDIGTSSFPVAAVHRIGILDVRIFNTDRHSGNLLVRKVEDGFGRFGGKMELIPIDHGLCLPESLEDPYFEWIHWPQASVPFSEDELEYIANLDPAKDCDMLRRELPMVREACLRVLVLCTIFLKEAATFGLCLAEIGEMMSREFKRMEEEPSELEVVCMEARKLLAEREAFSVKSDQEDENDFQFHIDCEEDNEPMVFKSVDSYGSGYNGGSFRGIERSRSLHRRLSPCFAAIVLCSSPPAPSNPSSPVPSSSHPKTWMSSSAISSLSSASSSSLRLLSSCRRPPRPLVLSFLPSKSLLFSNPISFQSIPLKSSSSSSSFPQPPIRAQQQQDVAADADADADVDVSSLPPKLREIVQLFQSVPDPRAKYQQLLHYGARLPPLDARYKTDANRVRGCVSQVWVRAFPDPDFAACDSDNGCLVRFEADSDSALTKGLAALLVFGLSGSPASVIARVPPNFIRLLGLRQSLTPSRNNGFLNMLQLIQRKAIQLKESSGDDAGVSSEPEGDDSAHKGGILEGKMSTLGPNEATEVGKDSNFEDKVQIVNGSGILTSYPVLGHDESSLKKDEGDANNVASTSSGSRGSGSRRIDRIREKLESELSPVELKVEDISHHHAGHAGVRGNTGGETHFNLRVVSKEFEGKSLVKRHRLIYGLLQEELKNGLHALSIDAKTPAEVQSS